jgi:hypothetical protein
LSDKQPVHGDDTETEYASPHIPEFISGLSLTEKAFNASATQQICNVDAAMITPPDSPLQIASDARPFIDFPCPSEDNQSGNFMPACCSPAHASSNGTKAQPQEAEESESEDSSIRNPPSIVQVPSPFPLQVPVSPCLTEQIMPCNEAAGDAGAPCNEIIVSDRVSSTLTDSSSDEDPSIITVESKSKVSPRLSSPSLHSSGGLQMKVLNRNDEGTKPSTEAAPLVPGVLIDEAPSCGRAPLFGAFELPKSIMSFVTFADEMFAQQQSQFLCCGQDELATVVNIDPDHPNKADSTGASTVLETNDSILNLFSASGSTDPISAIPVEAVLRGACPEKSIAENTLVLDECANQRFSHQGTGEIEEMGCMNERSGSTYDVPGRSDQSSTVSMGQAKTLHHIRPDGGTLHSESFIDRDVEIVAECELVIRDKDVSGGELRFECKAGQDDTIATDSYVESYAPSDLASLEGTTEPSGLPPPLFHASFGVHHVQSLESSQDWNEIVCEESCAATADDTIDGKSCFKSCSIISHSSLMKTPAGTGGEVSLITGEFVTTVGSRCFTDEPEDPTALEVVHEIEQHDQGEAVEVCQDDIPMQLLQGVESTESLAPANLEVSAALPAGEELDSASASPMKPDTSVLPHDSKEQPVLSTGNGFGSESVETSSDGISNAVDALGSHHGLDPTVLSPLHSDHDILATSEPESDPKGVNLSLDLGGALENPPCQTLDCTSSKEPCLQPTESLVSVHTASTKSTQESLGDRNFSMSEGKGRVRHSPRNWRSANQKIAEEARAKAIARIRQRKLKELQSVTESKESGEVDSKAKKLQYSAEEGVARAIRRMKEFRRSEKAHSSELRKHPSHEANKSKSETEQVGSRARQWCPKTEDLHVRGANKPMTSRDRAQCAKIASTTMNELQCSTEASTRLETGRHLRGTNCKERPRQSFITAPRATRVPVVRKRDDGLVSAKHSQNLPPTRSMDESKSTGEEFVTYDLQSAKSFPSYMRPTISLSAPVYRRTESNHWAHSRGDISLAASSRVLQSMLRSEHPVAMNTGLWKWYARPLPPRTLPTRRK